ncbi:MAG: 30S ribosomal protein S6 [bacterium]|nr:30S ribosomal protein S6 [bacterium]
MDSVKNYEIAYLLPISLSEEEVLTYTHKLSSWIEDAKAVVKYSETPKKRRLAYPIRKETGAYFGWMTFSSSPSFIKSIDKNIKNDKDILRYLIVDRTGEETQVRPVYYAPTKTTEQPAASTQENKTDEKLDLEELDKKLEEILGK